ncbi:DUF4350 domain-containing protein [[Eubacterium] cellulosolvens]
MIFQKIIEKFGKLLIACFLLILIAVSILLLATPGHKSQLSIYSEDWDDLSKFKDDLDALKFTVSHVSSSPIYLRELEHPEEAIFIIAGLEREYTFLEVDAISEFINQGGSVILADDFGYGNKVLENLRIRLEYFGVFDLGTYQVGYELLNEQVVDIEYDRDPNYIRVRTETPIQYELLLNAPSGFIENKDIDIYTYDYLEVEVLAQSSSMSWLDLNGNFSRDTGERAGPFDFILRFSIAPLYEIDISNLLVLSDPSIFINEMWDQADNREFILSQITQMLPKGGEVIFDESVHINENTISELTNGYYLFFIYIFSHPGFILLIEFFLIILLIGLVTRKKPKTYYTRHKDTLDSKWLYSMRRPELDLTDFHWIRWVIMEKIRVGYEIPYEVFYSYTPEQFKVLLDDDEISEFLFGNGKSDQQPRFMRVDEEIVNRIIAWEPNKMIFTKIAAKFFEATNSKKVVPEKVTKNK